MVRSILFVIRCDVKALAVCVFLAGGAWAQVPDGTGKTETGRVCSKCHELTTSTSRRQDRAGWEATVNKMVALGAEITDKETAAILDYLAAHFPAEEVSRINVNKASALDLESGLSFRRSEAASIIEYRTKNGPFRSIEDLKKVPGIDAAKVEAKKNRVSF